MKQLARALALAVLALPVTSLQAAPQSATELLRQAEEAWTQRLQGVQDVTVVQETMGASRTTYMEKEMVEGRPVLRPRITLVGGVRTEVEEGEHASWADFLHPGYADRARLEGRGEVDGHPTHILVLEELAGTGPWSAAVPGEDEFQPRAVTLHLDTRLFVVRAMTLEGEAVREGERHPLAAEVFFEDIREVDGLLFPFRTRVAMDTGESMLTPEEREEMRKGLEEFRRELEQAPPAQRRMMEAMMGPRMEQMVQQLEEGRMEVTTEVRELRVNAGPPR